MALSDYKNDIYSSKEIILSICRAINYNNDSMKFNTVYPMDKSMYHTIILNDKQVYEVKVTIKATRVERGDGVLNKETGKRAVLNELYNRFHYLNFYKIFFHAGNIILNDAKKTYEVKLVLKKAV